MKLYPIIFIKNSLTTYAKNGIVINKEFTWDNLIQVILNDAAENIISVQLKWNSPLGFENHFSDVILINEKASEDSVFGYLTKRKIERITQKVSAFPKEKKSKKNIQEQNTLFDTEVIEDLLVEESEPEYGNNKIDNLILIEGKAGTGKTSELINLMLQNLISKRNARYLTYNHLLVYDIARTIKSFANSNTKYDIGMHSVMTLHQFFIGFQGIWGVLHLMTEKRIEELKGVF